MDPPRSLEPFHADDHTELIEDLRRDIPERSAHARPDPLKRSGTGILTYLVEPRILKQELVPSMH